MVQTCLDTITVAIGVYIIMAMTLTIISSCLCSETWQRWCRLAWKLWSQVSTLPLPSWQWPLTSCPLVCVQKLGRDGADFPGHHNCGYRCLQYHYYHGNDPDHHVLMFVFRNLAEMVQTCGHRCLHYHCHHGNGPNHHVLLFVFKNLAEMVQTCAHRCRPTLSLLSWQWPFPSCPHVCVQKLGRDGADLWPQMSTLSLPSWQWPLPSCPLVCVQKLGRDGADFPGHHNCGYRCLQYHYYHGNGPDHHV